MKHRTPLLIEALAELRRRLPAGSDWVRHVLGSVIEARADAAGLRLPERPYGETRASQEFAFPFSANRSLGSIYEELMSLEPVGPDSFELRPARSKGRKAAGSYYTPERLCGALLDATLEPLMLGRGASNLRVVDPAVGAGQFLIAAAERMARAAPIEEIVRRRLFGVDLDPVAVELCRYELWLLCGGAVWPLENIRVGNSLLGATRALLKGGIPDAAFVYGEGDDPKRCRLLRARNKLERGDVAHVPLTQLDADAWCAAFTLPKRDGPVPTTAHLGTWTAGELEFHSCVRSGAPVNARTEREALILAVANEARARSFFHWELEFPDIEFDLVIGNPPFVNGIERRSPDGADRIGGLRSPLVTGAADLSFRFLGASPDWVKAGGTISFVLPRSSLNAKSLTRFREELPDGLTPRLICPLKSPDFFSGAAVYVTLLALGPAGPCLIPKVEGSLGDWQIAISIDANWFLSSLSEPPPGVAGVPLGEVFEVGASMTAGEAYELVSALEDKAQGPGLKLLTTGLIEPGRSLWGQVPCRYLKQTYTNPRVAAANLTAVSLLKRQAAAARPKVLVAGLGSRLEAFFDADGEHLGAVSTYTITHPTDDRRTLAALTSFLCCEETTARFRAELGSNALGGGSITVTKAWLRNLVWPGFTG